jgi:hypothetical protein
VRQAVDPAPAGSSQVLAQALDKGIPHFSLCRLGAVFDLGQQLGLDLDPAMRNPFAIGCVLRISGARRARRSAAETRSKPRSTVPDQLTVGVALDIDPFQLFPSSAKGDSFR